ncbi:MAG: hypothetical protein AAFV98_19220 [Chloroflexota bacterium]
MKRKRISVHRPKGYTRSFILLMALFIAGMHVFLLRTMMASPQETAFPLGILALILLFDALFLWWGVIFTTQSQITLYEEGIELQRGGAKVFTPWDNVSHFGIRGGGKNARRGIFLHEHAQPEARGLVDRLMFGWQTNFIPIGQYTHLPRTWALFNRQIDTEKVLNSDFGRDVYALAPHLFKDVDFDVYKPKNDLHDTVNYDDYYASRGYDDGETAMKNKA